MRISDWSSDVCSSDLARPAWVIFPTFKIGAPVTFAPRSKADTLIELGRNAFNYSIHGERGFEVLSRLVDDCTCYSLTYSELSEALSLFDSLDAAPARAAGMRA